MQSFMFWILISQSVTHTLKWIAASWIIAEQLDNFESFMFGLVLICHCESQQ